MGNGWRAGFRLRRGGFGWAMERKQRDSQKCPQMDSVPVGRLTFTVV